ncbi:hypothetical protein ACQJBY_067084 [Aegilops geniculata]
MREAHISSNIKAHSEESLTLHGAIARGRRDQRHPSRPPRFRSGGNGHVIEDVEGGTGVNGQMGFLGTEEKDAAVTRTGFHFQPEKNL